jgi:aspartate aminotransferase
LKLAERTSRLTPSATLAIDALAKQMKAEGKDVVGFGVGEPDFDTPQNVKEVAINSIKQGFTKYTPAGGILELKEAIKTKLYRDNGLNYDVSQIVVCVGAKHALFNAFQVLLDPEDEVIVPAPYWVSYIDQIRLTGAEPVIVSGSEENGFKITQDQLRKSITKKTKAIVINSPSNPTGAVYSKEELEPLAELVVENDLLAISDEIYEPFIYTDRGHVPFASLGEEVKDHTLLIHGVSKSHSMTGWRIGYAAGPTEIIKQMANIQSHSTSNPTSFAQTGAIEALLGPDDSVKIMVREFTKRRDYLVNRLNSIPGVKCSLPNGAFYAFPNISASFGKESANGIINNSNDFAQNLLKEANVALVPGSAFGAEGFVRISYATSMENIKKGLDRIEAFWLSLK